MNPLEHAVGVLISLNPTLQIANILEHLRIGSSATGAALVSLIEERPVVVASSGLTDEAWASLLPLVSAGRNELAVGRDVKGNDYVMLAVRQKQSLLGVVYLQKPGRGPGYENPAVSGLLSALGQGLVRWRENAQTGTPDDAAARSTTKVDDMHREQLISALERAKWNIAAAARQLGVTRRTVYERLRRFGLDREGEGVKPKGRRAAPKRLVPQKS